eukprot:gene19024-912_t
MWPRTTSSPKTKCAIFRVSKMWEDLVSRFQQLGHATVNAQKLKRNLIQRGYPLEDTKCDHAWRMALKGVSADMLVDDTEPGQGNLGDPPSGLTHSDPNVLAMFRMTQLQLQQQAEKLEALENREKKEHKLHRRKVVGELVEYDAATYLPYARLNGLRVELRMEKMFRISSKEDVSDEQGERLDVYEALKAQLNLALNTGVEDSDGIWTDVIQKMINILRGKVARLKGISTREANNLVYAQVNSDDVLGVAYRKVAARNAAAAKNQGNPRNAANPANRNPDNRLCFNCGKSGHIARGCPRRLQDDSVEPSVRSLQLFQRPPGGTSQEEVELRTMIQKLKDAAVEPKTVELHRRIWREVQEYTKGRCLHYQDQET